MKTVPNAVRRFEMTMYLFLLIGATTAVLRQTVSNFRFDSDMGGDFGPLSAFCFQASSISLNLLLTYFITRRKSTVAKWIFTVFYGLGIIGQIFVGYSVRHSIGNESVSLLVIPLTLYMIYLLFTPEFESWFKKSKPKNQSVLIPYFLGSTAVLFLIWVGVLVYRQFTGMVYPAGIYKEISERYLKESITAIEYYKQIHGSYPQMLDDLQGKKFDEDMTFLYDSSGGATLSMRFHQYKILPDGKHYTIFDVGPDGVSGTADDIFPIIPAIEASHIGYVGEEGR